MQRITGCIRILLAALGLFAASGCVPSLIPPAPTSPSTFDFGPIPITGAEQLRRTVRLGMVGAPSWLNGLDIRYRRLDEQPGALRAYAQSQWVAPVPELFAQRLSRRLTQAAPNERSPERVLRVEILSFEQVFAAPDQAYVSMQAHATLEGDAGRIGEREFESRRPSPPHVQGATSELPAVADDLIDAVMQWLLEIDARPPS